MKTGGQNIYGKTDLRETYKFQTTPAKRPKSKGSLMVTRARCTIAKAEQFNEVWGKVHQVAERKGALIKRGTRYSKTYEGL